MRRKLKMTDEKKGQGRKDESLNDRSRRDFVAMSVAAGLVATTRSASGARLQVIETNVEVKTPDGICDAAFIHPAKGSHPGVLVWPDSGGLRPAFRELGRRIAAEGYAVLTPNHLYRTARSPVFDESFDPVKNPADREKYS
jgi:carboxymethylenebutenolidase